VAIPLKYSRVNRFAVFKVKEAGVEAFNRSFIFHAYNKYFIYFQQEVMHLVRRFPIYGISAAGVKDDLKLFLINMIADPQRRCLEGFIMHKTHLATSVNDKADIHGTVSLQGLKTD